MASAPYDKAGQIGKCRCGARIRLPGQITTKKPALAAAPPPVSAAPPVTVARKPGRLLWIVLPLVGVACVGLGAGGVLLLTKGGMDQDKAAKVDKSNQVDESNPSEVEQPATPVAPVVDPDETKIRDCVTGWLEASKRGENGAIYWDDFRLLTNLFAVLSWEVLTPHPITVFESKGWPSALVRVRIDSSTKGGMQITHVWLFSMKKSGNEWKIRPAV